MRKHNPVTIALAAVAITQGLVGVLITMGCHCAPNFRLIGLAVSFGMAMVVGLFAVLSIMARKHAQVAMASAALLEGIVIILMLQPAIQAPLIAWYAQLGVYVLISVATIIAFQRG